MKIAKTRDVITPQRGKGSKFDRSGGIDFFVPKFDERFISDLKDKNPHVELHNNKIVLYKQERVLIPTGIKVNLETVNGFNKSTHNGIIMKCDNKSGVSTKTGLVIGATIIDEDYQGELHIHVINTSNRLCVIEEDFKLAQMLLIPIFVDNEIEVVDESELFTEESIRGEGGFGSTNIEEPKIKLIAALDQNWAIGNNNKLLVQSKAEMKHFVQTTTGHNILMGYNTFLSVGSKGLKNRFMYVLTSKSNLEPVENVKFINTQEFYDLITSRKFELKNKDLFICGGSQVYDYFLLNSNYDEAIITTFKTKGSEYDKTFDLSKVTANTESSETLEDNDEFIIIKYKK